MTSPMIRDIAIPDIGDFADVPVVEILIAPGSRVTEGETLLILESDKATLDIPAPCAGIVREVLIKVGDRVKQGSPALRLEIETAQTPGANTEPQPGLAGPDEADLVVIGAGPGGYTAAFRAADLGRQVVLIDARPELGGVCLNVGCIPSKALLHLAKLREDAREATDLGLGIAAPGPVDPARARAYKDGVVGRLTAGLAGLAARRKVRVIRGEARFTGSHSLEIDGKPLRFSQAIIAVGSSPARLPGLPEDPRIVDSTGALALESLPERLLVIGGGIIGLEMAQVYHGFGTRVEIVELADQLIPGADPDLVAPLRKHIGARYGRIRTGTRVLEVVAGAELSVRFSGPEGEETAQFDRILVAIGRRPNGHLINAEAAGITPEGPGFLRVDAQMRSAQPHIFAVGDVVGQPMLAHKATHEAKIAAEVACGHKVAFEPACIPSVAYTDPEIAWVGLTETEARAAGRKIRKGIFPWMASGRALSIGRGEGLTKLICDPETGRILGAGIVGAGAGELIAEAALAIEMQADAEDLGLTIHPHPTLSENLGLAAEAITGSLTDL